MLKRRIACILLILSALILYLFANETVTLALLVALIVIPLASVLMLALSGKNLVVKMSDVDTSGEHPVVHFHMENPDIVPVASLETELICENLRTGEIDSFNISESLGPKGRKDIDFELLPVRSGRYRISAAAAKISDPLMLSSLPMNCDDSSFITMMPETVDLQLSYASDAAMLENDRSADSRRGSDPGEVRGIREYVPGDPVRNIHWKLSEKTDKLLVKELGNPITDQFLVILGNESDVSHDPEALEASASVYSSIIHSLLRDGVRVSAAWTDYITGRAVIRKLENEDDARAAADEYLAVPAAKPNAFGRIERDISESRYAHIIIVGTKVPAGIESIANGCNVSVLMCGMVGSATENNVTVIGFEPGSYMSDLAGIEV